MKRLLTLLFLTSLLSAFQCDDKEASPCPDDFIKNKIAELQAQPKQNPAAEITEYSFRGETVYMVSSDCCDQFNYLYDGCGQVLCAPSGGITGRGDGLCPDFNTEATNARVVWRDPR
jgi:hypothetical protein